VRRRFASPFSATPKRWTRSVQTALIHVMSMAHYALVHTQSWVANGSTERARLSAKCDQLDHEVLLLRDELRSFANRPGSGGPSRSGQWSYRGSSGSGVASQMRIFWSAEALISRCPSAEKRTLPTRCVWPRKAKIS